jgi:putative CocE/NonD family hydrolase
MPDSPYLSLMDYFVKGEDTGILDRPAVTYYVMGAVGESEAPGNEWRYADDWPVPHVPTPFYLHQDGMLDTAAPVDDSPSTWVFDPANPCPNIGGRNLYEPKGIFDQASIEDRSDNLIFTTPVLETPLEATGRVKCLFYISSDAIDTDVAVRLSDVYPDGRSMLVLDGILRLRCRESFSAPTPLTPGQVYEVEVDLWSTSYIFNAGHRIRLAVTGSNYPRWDLNPGTGEIWEDGCSYVAQQNTLYHSQTYPSALILPVPIG